MKVWKTTRKFFALVLAMALSFGMFTTAFGGTATSPAEAVITKVLQMPEGTTTPNAHFEFEITKVSLDGQTGEAALAQMPDLADVTINFTGTDTGSVVAGLKQVIVESGNILAGVTWTQTGVFKYKVVETEGTYITSTGETMTYSPASYEVAVLVNYDAATDTYFAEQVTAIIGTEDTSAQDVGTKVDATPGAGGMVFTNTFTKVLGGPDPDDSVLSISKEVAGDYADPQKYFPFTLTVNKAATLSSTVTYKVYVLDAAGTVVTSTNHADENHIKSDGTENYIEVTSGVPIVVSLKDGERLSFVDMAVGTSYTVMEQANVSYTPSAVVVVNGATPQTLTGSANSALTVGENLIGESTNTVDFTNTSTTVAPTGITLNQVPFIVMIGLAVAALGCYVWVKTRKRESEQE